MSSTTLRLTKRCQFRGTTPQTSISIKFCNMRKELAEKGCLVPLQGLGRGALYCLILEEFLSLTPKKKRFVKSESVSNMRWLVCHSMVEYLLHQKTSIGLLDAVETNTGERWHSGRPPVMSEDRIAILVPSLEGFRKSSHTCPHSEYGPRGAEAIKSYDLSTADTAGWEWHIREAEPNTTSWESAGRWGQIF